MNQRQEAAQKTKTSIARAGERLFRQRGIDDVTVADITREAGVTRTIFYAHFKSKDELVLLLISNLDAAYLHFYENTLCAEQNGALSPLERLERLLIESNHIMAEPGAVLLRQYYGLMLRNPEKPLTNRYYDKLVWALIAQCREKGLLNEQYRDEDIFRTALSLNRGICMGWALQGGVEPIESQDVLLHNFCISISAAVGRIGQRRQG